MINDMLNTIEILTHITLERKTEKKITTESSDEETKNIRKRKRKGTNNMDEINENIPKKRIKAKRVVYPTDTLTEPKKTKKEKT